MGICKIGIGKAYGHIVWASINYLLGTVCWFVVV